MPQSHPGNKGRTRTAVVSLCGLTALMFAWDQAPGQQPASEGSPKALVNQYCVTCHNQKLKTGGLELDAVDPDHPSANPETWEKVVRKVRAGLMPPSGARRPDRKTLDVFAAMIEGALDRAALANPNPGRTPLHRMNRVEYANAIRDLLSLEVDPAVLLPADDSSNGFDNIADVLGISPALLERYVSAAARISRMAVGDPETAPSDVTYTLKSDLSQTGPIEGLPLGTRGGTVVRHNFPLDGEYLIKLALYRVSFGQVFGEGAKGEKIEVTLNGDRVKIYELQEVPMFFMRERPGETPAPPPVTDPLAERVKMSQDIHLEFRLPVKAGPQEVGVAFLQKAWSANEDLVHRPMNTTHDSNIGMQYGYTTVPHLAKVDITGPYKPAGSGDTPSRRRVFLCHPASSAGEIPCAKQIIANLVRRAFRRESRESDSEQLLSLYQQARNEKGSFEAGIEMVFRRVLADPEFVFRFEPSPAGVPPGGSYRLSDTELASRLSFFIWSSIPDDELLDLAIKGKLHEPAILARQARRMLQDRRSHALAANFAGQWLYLRELRNAVPDSREFPDFDDNLRRAMQRETEMLFESILRDDRSVLDLLDADYTFVNERLARHYGIPNVYGPDFRRVPAPNEDRRGLLGQASILTVTSNANRTSPVQRGKWILENLLGSPPPLPPPNVPPLKENGAENGATSVRARIEEHRANPVCAACHKIMDPIGLSLENFDGAGHWRDMDSGFKVDPSSQLVDGTKVDGPAGLRQALLNRSEAFVGTMTEKLLMYAIGRETRYYDMPVVRAIMHDSARADSPQRGYRMSALILGIVNSAPFQMRVREVPQRGAETTNVTPKKSEIERGTQ
jgi:mono/diheme cytochrome c family protein